MSKNFSRILHILFTHGHYSKPFVVSSIQFFSGVERSYLRARLFSWKNKYDQALYEIEKGIKYRSSQCTKYILLTLKLSLLSKMRDKEAEKLIVLLKKSFDKVPPVARKLIMSTVLNHSIRNYGEDRIRTWGKLYKDDPATWCAIQIAHARKLYREGNVRKSTITLIDVYKKAEKF